MDYSEYMKIYYTEHYCCPVCHSKNFSSTLAGYAYDSSKPEEYKDLNSCHCYTCGWEGNRHELVPKPEKTAFKIGMLDENDICYDIDVRQNYDNKLYIKDEALKIVENLRNNSHGRYYYCYEVEIHQDIK